MKKDPPTVFFCAIVKLCDAFSASITDETLSDDIACLFADEFYEYTDKIRALIFRGLWQSSPKTGLIKFAPCFTNTKTICKPLGTLPP
jgi:hypothetical protein